MYTITVRNVNEALPIGALLLRQNGRRVVSRGVEVLEYPEPVATTYLRPRERVLFNPLRDANPFFHYMEALWMLAGRRDVGWVKYFLPRIADYSDNGHEFHGAYGWRLRHGFGGDQIEHAVRLLQLKPDTRQAVLQIWDCARDLGADSKDIPCNDLVFLKIRNDALHMTVCCRSNDMLWGAYGANVVQFSMLQEYIAALLDVGVGPYTQLSDSFHVYPSVPYWRDYWAGDIWGMHDYNEYTGHHVSPHGLFDEPQLIDDEMKHFFDRWDQDKGISAFEYSTPLLRCAAFMLDAYTLYKEGNMKNALIMVSWLPATDWRTACMAWLQRREPK